MKGLHITDLDHIVLNVRDVEKTVRFYTEVLGLQPERLEEFRAGKVGFPSVRINSQTIIDLFPTKDDAEPRQNGAKTNGNLNHFCMVVGQKDFAGIVDYLNQKGVAIREGPISRWGARGRATSVYFLDPDGNEVEIRCY